MGNVYALDHDRRRQPIWGGMRIAAASVGVAIAIGAVAGVLVTRVGSIGLAGTGEAHDAAPVVAALSSQPSGPYFSRGISVTDGDTVNVQGQAFRLVGFNAPETYRAECASEKALGNRATSRLRSLLAAGNVSLQPVACACPPGTEGTDACNYGRSCGILRAAGRDVGAILISEGLAVPFNCRGNSCPPTPRPWCG